MKWQKKVDNMVNKLSAKHQIEKNQLDYMLFEFFSNMKKNIQREDMPTIMIHKFGEFYPSLPQLRRQLKTLEVKKNKDMVSQEEYQEHKKYLEELINRLENEKTTRDE